MFNVHDEVNNMTWGKCNKLYYFNCLRNYYHYNYYYTTEIISIFEMGLMRGSS